MKTLGEVLKLSEEFLEDRKRAEEVVSAALNMKRLDLYLHFDKPLDQKELDRCRSYLKRRKDGEPIQYIIGEVEFFDCTFEVEKGVLIPRPETEELVGKIAEELKGQEGKVLWDVCCGSGCIGISLKKAIPGLKVVLADLSPEAVKMARKNAEKNGVDVEVREGDLLQPFAGEQAHYIVSNPPYVPDDIYTTLQPEVNRYEPKMAFVGGQTGSEFYKRFAEEAPAFLEPGGKIWFEIGDREVTELFDASKWTNSSIEPDFMNRPRYFSIEKLKEV